MSCSSPAGPRTRRPRLPRPRNLPPTPRSSAVRSTETAPSTTPSSLTPTNLRSAVFSEVATRPASAPSSPSIAVLRHLAARLELGGDVGGDRLGGHVGVLLLHLRLELGNPRVLDDGHDRGRCRGSGLAEPLQALVLEPGVAARREAADHERPPPRPSPSGPASRLTAPPMSAPGRRPAANSAVSLDVDLAVLAFRITAASTMPIEPLALEFLQLLEGLASTGLSSWNAATTTCTGTSDIGSSSGTPSTGDPRRAESPLRDDLAAAPSCDGVRTDDDGGPWSGPGPDHPGDPGLGVIASGATVREAFVQRRKKAPQVGRTKGRRRIVLAVYNWTFGSCCGPWSCSSSGSCSSGCSSPCSRTSSGATTPRMGQGGVDVLIVSSRSSGS